MTLITLFFVCFGASTLLPGGSEALFIYEINQKSEPFFLLLLIASLGNTLGSCVNYFLGKYASQFAIKKNYMKEDSIKKAELFFDKYGIFALLLSWTPIIGDPITFVAGILKYRFVSFFIIVGIAKTLRYFILGIFMF